MTERHSDYVELYVSPEADAGETRNGDSTFATLDGALSEAGRRYTADDIRATDIPPLSIRRRDPTQPGPRRARRPAYHYYVDANRFSDVADGTESAPWPDLRAAVLGIKQLNQQGAIKLAAGDWILIEHKDIFTPTAIERRKRISELIAKYVFLTAALLLVAPVIAILWELTYKAWPVLSFEFLFTNPKNQMTAGGVWSPLIGTFFLVLISLLAAAPIGILAGVYLNEYARDNWLTRIINLGVVNLAGVPSIVHGLFGFGAFVLFAGMGRSLLAASLTLAVMTLPVIITSTREALAAVPMSFREACWNMGASRWQTIRTIVLPNSISGILTGVILQVARAAGETAPILFTGAVFWVMVPQSGVRAYLPYGLGDPVMALSYHLYALKDQVRDVPEALLFGTAVVLIGLVLAVNSVSIAIRVYLRSRKKW